MPKTILVTGGTGYIAGEIIDQLLEAGHVVHTTVRDRRKSEDGLRDLASKLPGPSEIVPVDVTDADALAKAAEQIGEVDGVQVPSPGTIRVRFR